MSCSLNCPDSSDPIMKPLANLLTFSMLAAVTAPAAHRVSQKDKAFSQATITVQTGETLVIENQDKVVHHLFSMTPSYSLDQAQPPGTESTLTFEESGVVEIRCAIHPEMKLHVQVEAP